MKILIELSVIFFSCLAGEVLSLIIPFPVPAAVLALAVLLILLLTGLVKEESIKDAGNWLLKTMAFFFVPAGVKMLEHFSLLGSIWLPVLVISVLSTVIVFLVTAFTVKLVMRIKGER
ncbi:MAG: CidA/LrgA family protein [Bullifex sp.]